MPATDGMLAADDRPIVLASASAVRTRLLASAGVPHEILPADIDEADVRDRLVAEDAAHEQVAEVLAELKAQKIAAARPDAIVLGADQVLSCADELFEKPAGRDGVRDHLRRLRGRSHTLHTAVCAVIDSQVTWHHTARADLRMRALSDEFIERYVAAAGDSACQSVGAYEMEWLGVHLFEAIDGDFYSILGLPLLPLLVFLRGEQVVMA